MKSTEIIQKLLDEKKITAEEALCLLQDMTQPSIIQPQPTWTYPYNPGEVWCGTTSTLQQGESNCYQCCNTKTENIEENQPNIITEGYVDLGLPSGTLWAACNYGCSSPIMFGQHLNFDEAQILDCTLPSKEQIDELKKHTTYTWGSFNGCKGGIFTGENGNSIFLPAAGYTTISSTRVSDKGSLYNDSSRYFGFDDSGYYWSSSFSFDLPYTAHTLDFLDNGFGWGKNIRDCGLSVRPVKNKL